MFETLSHAALQEYWWAIMSLLGGVLVFLLGGLIYLLWSLLVAINNNP